MTELEKIDALDKKILTKHPNLKGEELIEFRNNYILKHRKLTSYNLILGTILIIATCVDTFFFKSNIGWIFVILVMILGIANVSIREKLPYLKNTKLDSTSSGKKPVTLLTVARISQDCQKVHKKSYGWLVLIFIIVLISSIAYMHGIDSVLEDWYIFLPIIVLAIFAIILAQLKSNTLKKDILNGNFRIVQSHLVDKEEIEDTSGDSTTYEYILYFRRTGDLKPTTYKATYGYWKNSIIGEMFYLILFMDKKGRESLLRVYHAETNPLDEQLHNMLYFHL